jgi:hypothetical protein
LSAPLGYVSSANLIKESAGWSAMFLRKSKMIVQFVWKFRYIRFLLQTVIELGKIEHEVGSQQTVRGLEWIKKKFQMPAPNFVKWEVMKRWGGRKTWVETGTYLGETTEYLSKASSLILSIEPSQELASLATEKFIHNRNVRIIRGTSEEVLGDTLDCLSDLDKQDVSFWLDGHFSSGRTFLGSKESPIEDELLIIESRIHEFTQVTILVDDFRAFSTFKKKNENYPQRTFLVEWADKQQLEWTIEHDIFVMTNRSYS